MTRAGNDSLPSRRPFVSLRGSAEFARVYRSGTRRRFGTVLVIAAEGNEGRPQVGVVAGRKIGGAVVRNRAKRRLREALLSVELGDDMSYVVVALPGVAEATFDEIAGWVRKAVRAVRTPKTKEQE